MNQCANVRNALCTCGCACVRILLFAPTNAQIFVHLQLFLLQNAFDVGKFKPWSFALEYNIRRSKYRLTVNEVMHSWNNLKALKKSSKFHSDWKVKRFSSNNSPMYSRIARLFPVLILCIDVKHYCKFHGFASRINGTLCFVISCHSG